MTRSYPIDTVRSLFPALSLSDNGQRRVYLDNPAGTQVPQSVGDAIRDAVLHRNANLGGAFMTSRQAGEILAGAHQAMAEFLGAASADEIVIGPNMTSLTYQFSRVFSRDLQAGDEIVLTQIDHEGNVGPWMQAAEDRGVTIRWLPFSENSWQIEPDALRPLLNRKTRLVALNYASNLTGSINPIDELVRLAREAGAVTYVDAVQMAPHGLIDVQKLGCDFLACSSYKFYGPHLGIVYGRRQMLDSLRPYKLRCSSNDYPTRYETGTPQIELLVGLEATVEHIAAMGALKGAKGGRRERIAATFASSARHETALAKQLIDGIRDIDGLRIIGISNEGRLSERVATVSFTVEGIAPSSLVELLNHEGIFCWAGHNYAWGIVHQLGIPAERGVSRIGIAKYNTSREIEETVESVRRNLAMLRQRR
jgi:cysteine desulfurase family protein (TIGR01976 family)